MVSAELGFLFGASTIILIIVAVGIAVFAAWLYTLVDAIRRDFPGENDKLLWVLVILFAGIIGSILYYAIVLSDDE